MKRKTLTVLLLSVLCALDVDARPLGLRPDPEPQNLTFLGGVRSDLWATAYANKNAPLRMYEFRFASPFLSGAKWTTSVSAEIEGLSSGRADLLVGRHRVLIGPDLRAQAYGLMVNRTAEDQSSFSLSAAYASASDDPYEHARDRWYDSSGIYRFAPGEEFQWLAGFQYSRNRGFYNNLLLPVVGVVYRPRPGFMAIFGLPFISFRWEDPDAWTTDFTTTYTSVVLDSHKKLNDLQSLFLRVGFASRAYLHENRVEDDMRLFFEEKYVDAGVRTKLSDVTSIYMSVGKSFDRNFYEAKTIYNALGPKTNMDADYYGRLYFLVQL